MGNGIGREGNVGCVRGVECVNIHGVNGLTRADREVPLVLHAARAFPAWQAEDVQLVAAVEHGNALRHPEIVRDCLFQGEVIDNCMTVRDGTEYDEAVPRHEHRGGVGGLRGAECRHFRVRVGVRRGEVNELRHG